VPSIERAYSTLTIKSVDQEQRIIRGVASTPDPDRIGDIVEPHGARFRNPLSLLFHHQPDQPVGTVELDAPTDQGIGFTAHLPDIDEPGTLKTRIQEAWQSIKAKLIRGVSIGFRADDDGIEFLKDSGGLRFTKYEILELSLVSIPANSHATIHTIKSFDRSYLAASGERQPSGVSDRPGVVHVTPIEQLSMKPTDYAEQIRTLEANRETKKSDLLALQDKVTKEGRTKDAAERESFEQLTADIRALDQEIADVRVTEELNIQRAAPVAGDTSAAGSASRGTMGNGNRASITVRGPQLEPGIAFARYVHCSVVAHRHGLSVLDIAKARYPDHAALHAFVLRAAVPPATTTDATWAKPLVDDTGVAQDFVEYVRPRTIVGKFGLNGIPPLYKTDFNLKVKQQTSGGTAYWVGEGKPKPVTKWGYSSTAMLPTKIAAIAVLTEELARFSSPNAETQFRDELTRAVVERMDLSFIDPSLAAVVGVNPASVTNGVTPIVSTGDPRADLEALIGAFITANADPVGLVLIMPSALALSLGLRVNPLGQSEFPSVSQTGGSVLGIPTITSQYAAQTGEGNLVIAVNAPEIYLADDGQVTVDASREASLEMSDAPTNAANPPTAATLVSLWQNDAIGLRAERMINWAKRRPDAVQFMPNVDWTAPGSPAVLGAAPSAAARATPPRRVQSS
jgi:HK97 family phage prohead protease